MRISDCSSDVCSSDLIEPPPLRLLINRVHPVSSNARLVQQALRQVFQEQAGVQVLGTDVPAIEAYPRAATRGLPVHRVEYQIGRAACRERVCQYVKISVVAVSFTKNIR